MKKITFNARIANKNYNFYASWDSNKKVKSIFSSNVNGIYTGEINLFGKQAYNFINCLEKLNTKTLSNKHLSRNENNEDCFLTFNNDDVLTQNKWNMYTFPKDVDYLYTAIALCDTKFLDIFKKRIC